jgi:hypothetical protein
MIYGMLLKLQGTIVRLKTAKTNGFYSGLIPQQTHWNGNGRNVFHAMPAQKKYLPLFADQE